MKKQRDKGGETITELGGWYASMVFRFGTGSNRKRNKPPKNCEVTYSVCI